VPDDLDERSKEIISRVQEFTMTSPERIFALCEAVRYLEKNGIPGDIVECGVWKGGSAMACALTLLDLKSIGRRIYLYDTFKGMSEPTERDIEHHTNTAAHSTWSKMQANQYNEWCYAPLNEVHRNLASTGYPEENLCYVEGKVEDTIPATLPSQIALLRLDTDWYESTYHELKHLYPLLVKNGVLILDDYGHWEGAKSAADQYFYENNISLLLFRADYSGRFGIKINP
jgi:hypothetical protein